MNWLPISNHPPRGVDLLVSDGTHIICCQLKRWKDDWIIRPPEFILGENILVALPNPPIKWMRMPKP